MFPESVCNNGLYLSKFRRGAFNAERAVQPLVSTYDWDTVHPGYDCINGVHQFPLFFTQFSFNKITMDVYPIFQPNEYLFTEYRKQIPGGEKLERWEVYAHAVRDFMSEVGGFGLNDQPIRDRISYQNYMFKKTNDVTLADRDPTLTFYYPHDPEKTRDCSDYPPAYITKETSRLTKHDFLTNGKLINTVKHLKRD